MPATEAAEPAVGRDPWSAELRVPGDRQHTAAPQMLTKPGLSVQHVRVPNSGVEGATTVVFMQPGDGVKSRTWSGPTD